MKARIKGESEWKDYKIVFSPDGTFLGLETAGCYYDESESRQYNSAILPLECFDLWSEPDWDAYCREVAKDIFVGMITGNNISRGDVRADCYTSRWAIRVAKNFVDDLKEEI